MDKKETLEIMEFFKEVELTEDYDPYFCSVEGAISIVIIGTFCGFQNLNQIHHWADHEKVKAELKEHFGIQVVPSYFWLTRLLKIINPDSLNECFIRWVTSLLPEDLDGKTVSFDGKTICSTGKMDAFDQPLHIVSAQIAELGLTFAQESVASKSNEIPATQRLIKTLKLKGSVVVADALNCQKDTATAIITQKADYLLSVKDNQPTLKRDIEDFVQDADLQKNMETAFTKEKNRGRIEKRTGFVSHDVKWLKKDHDWEKLVCFGAIHSEFESKNGKSSEWHYFISSKLLTPEELLKHARAEWSVETMHWLLDVHFKEDECRVQEESVQKVLNMLRKVVINHLRRYKEVTGTKSAFTHIMMDCSIDIGHIQDICGVVAKADGEN